jgi:hypothetical protein
MVMQKRSSDVLVVIVALLGVAVGACDDEEPTASPDARRTTDAPTNPDTGATIDGDRDVPDGPPDAGQMAACLPPNFEYASTRIESAAGTVGCVQGGWVPGPPAGSGDAAAAQDAGGPLTIGWTGKIVSADVNGFSLDECGAASTCQPKLITFTLQARGLQLDLPVGAFVTVVGNFNDFYGCHHDVMVTNLASLGGVTNLADPRPGVVLAVSDGGLQDIRDLFKITARRQHCPGSSPIVDPNFEEYPFPTPMAQFPVPDTYTFHLAEQGSASGGKSLDLRMGETAIWSPGDGTLKYRVHNLRSFREDATEAYWDWAYWVQRLR